MADKITDVIPTNAFGGREMYGFALFERVGSVFKPLPVATNAPGEIVLRLNPQSITMDETAAVGFAPTLGGLGIEERGCLFKDCTISGDVGFMYGASTLPRPPGPPPVAMMGMLSGYADFLHLRNLFRRYWMIKSGEDTSYSDSNRKNVVLVFNNWKDNEFWVAVPLSFQMPPRRGMKYTYSIRLRLVEPKFDVPWVAPPPRSVVEAAQQTSSALTSLTDALNSAYAGLSNAAFGLIDDLLGPVNQLQTALSTVVKTGELPANLTQTVVGSLANQISQTMHSLSELLVIPAGLGEAMLDSYDRVCALGAEWTFFTNGITERYAALGARVKSYNDSAPGPFVSTTGTGGGNPADPSMPPTQNNITAVEIGAEGSIFDVARKYLGDVNRWVEIVTANGLVPPYITSNPAEVRQGVLGPNSTLLLPLGNTGVSLTPAMSSPDLTTSGVAFGTDLLVKGKDIGIDARGDVALVSGEANLEQAFSFKIDTEQGSLPLHPWFGLPELVGEKGTLRAILNSKVGVMSALSSDQRVAGIEDLSVNVEKDVMTIGARVRVKFDNSVRNFERSA